MEKTSSPIKNFVDKYARKKVGDGPMDRLEKLRQEKMAEIEAMRRENTMRVTHEINTIGDSLEFGNLVGRYARIAANKDVSDTERAVGAVAYASLYPTFGHEGISQLVAAWSNTNSVRKNATD